MTVGRVQSPALPLTALRSWASPFPLGASVSSSAKMGLDCPENKVPQVTGLDSGLHPTCHHVNTGSQTVLLTASHFTQLTSPYTMVLQGAFPVLPPSLDPLGTPAGL